MTVTQNIGADFRTRAESADALADYFIESTSVRLLGCGVKESPTERVDRFLSPAFLMVYYQRGSVEIRHGRVKTVLGPGSFFLFRPFDVYSGRRLGETPARFAYLQFDIAPFMTRYNFRTVAAFATDEVFQDVRYRRFGEMLEELAGDEPDKRGRSAMLRQLVKLILAEIVYGQAGQSGAPNILKNGRGFKAINHAFRYVDEHLSEPIVIGDILKDGRIGRASLERCFRKAFGATPRQALLRFKIERSMEMILQNVPLQEIARALGFSSVFHFSNTFKSVTGIRPSEYRKRTAAGRSGLPAQEMRAAFLRETAAETEKER